MITKKKNFSYRRRYKSKKNKQKTKDSCRSNEKSRFNILRLYRKNNDKKAAKT